MKNIYIILVVVLLFGVGGGVALFVRKRTKDSKKASPQVPTVQPKENSSILTEKPTSTSSTAAPKTNQTEDLSFDIVVSKVDTQNRRFEYDMHYQGIRQKGIYEEGVTGRIIQVKKGFGSFLIQHLEKAADSTVSTNGGATKGGTTSTATSKGGKMAGKTGTVTSKGGKIGGASLVSIPQYGLVNLAIIDNSNKTLKEVSVNIATGLILDHSRVGRPRTLTL